MSFEILIALVTVVSAVLAAIAWNTIGIWQVYRDGGVAVIDKLKVRKNVIIGMVLGIIGYGASLSGAIPLPVITDINTFILAVIAFFPAIIVAERIFTRKPPKSSTPTEKTD